MVQDGTDPETATREVVLFTQAIVVPVVNYKRYMIALRGVRVLLSYTLLGLLLSWLALGQLYRGPSIWVPGYIPAGVNWPCINMRET